MRIQSTLIQRASGALGNVSASTNKYGLVLQSRKSPRNNPTKAQIQNRQLFIEAGRAWGNLSPEIRESWNWVATQRHYHNKIGNHITLQGMNYFKAVYQKLKAAGIRVDIIQSQPQTVGNYLPQLKLQWGVRQAPNNFFCTWGGYGYQYIPFWSAQATPYTVRDYRKKQKFVMYGYRPNTIAQIHGVIPVNGINYFRYQLLANSGEESRVYQVEIYYAKGENLVNTKSNDAEGLDEQKTYLIPKENITTSQIK